MGCLAHDSRIGPDYRWLPGTGDARFRSARRDSQTVPGNQPADWQGAKQTFALIESMNVHKATAF